MEDIPREIILQASEGNLEAFEHVYKVTSGFVYNVALRVTSNEEDAQEVTQDVFLKIYKNLKIFRFESSFKTWVYRITVNTAINLYKKVSKELRRKTDYESIIKVHGIPSEVDGNIEKESRRSKIENLLEMLNPQQRVCIVLREIEGKNYKEISQILKININTVRTRLRRARAALLHYGQERGENNEM